MFAPLPNQRLLEIVPPGGHRRALPLRTLAATMLVLASTVPASAGPIGFGKSEVPRFYGQIATHRVLVGAVDTHALPGLPNQFWDSPVTLRGVTGMQDRVTATHRARHRVAVCPGEAAPAPWWTPPPISPPPRPFGPSMAGLRGKIRHPGPQNHDDYYAEVLAVRYWGAAPFKVWGYTFASAGVHDPDTCSAQGGMLASDAVVPPPPYTPTSYGSVVLVHDGGTNQFALSVAVQGISAPDLVDATLFVGMPGQIGQPFFSLGPGMIWEPVGPDGLGRVLTDIPFPQELVPALLEGNIYLQISTLELPGGELRAQIGVLSQSCAPTGDMDCDGDVDFFDIDPFVLALQGEIAYNAVYPECDWIRGDCNNDDLVDFFDIDPFVDLIGTCAP